MNNQQRKKLYRRTRTYVPPAARLALIFFVLITDKGVHPDLKPGRSRLSVLTSKVFMVFDLYSSKVIMSSGITHQR